MAVAHDITQKKRTCDVQISENVEFSGLLLSDSVLQGLKSCGFIRPSPIQLKAIPLGRCGLDLIVQAKSGTGKTCVFTVVALENIKLESSALQAVVLAPTREIAVQIWDVVTGIGKAMAGLECHTFIGGLPLQEDKAKLRKCHIAIGTPGRIKQLIELEVMKTKNVRMLILDEADKLLEADFQQQINWIYSTLPENKQMLALSATYPEYLAEHLTKYMRNPTFLRLNITDPALLGVKQYYLLVQYHPLPNNSFHIKSEAVVRLLSSMAFQQCLIFSNLQNRANNLAMELKSQGWPTACIAGSLDQTKRLAAMDELRSYQCRILISTDLTSRGIDADKVDLIIHLDVPKEHETYLHRTGRAGRYGSFGASVVIVSAGEEKRELEAVERKYNTRILPLPDPIPMDFTQQELSADLNQMVTSESILTCPASAVQPDGAVTACSPSHSSAGAAASSSGSLSGTLHQQPRENSSSVKTPQSLAQAETVPASTSEAESKLKSREENSSLEPVASINGHVKSREENSSLEPVAIINGHVKSREENSSLEPVAIINGHVKSREENSSLEPVAIINGHVKSREENSSLEPVAIINGHVKSREENSSLEPVAIINGHVKGPCGGEDVLESRATASRNEISLQDSAVQLANEPKQKSKTDCCNSNKGTASAESTSQTGGASGESRVSATITGKDAFPAIAEMPSAGNRGDTLCAFDKVPQASCCLGSEGSKHQDLSMSSVCSRLKLVAEGPSTRADVDGDLSPSEKVDNGDSPIGSSGRTNKQSEDSSVQEGKRLLDDLTKQAPFLPENAISSSLQEVGPKTGSVPAPNIFSVPSKKSVVTFSVSAFSYSGSGAQSQFSFTKSFPQHLSLAISPPAPCVSNSGRSDSSKRKRTQNPGDDFWDDRSSNDFSKQNTQEQPDSKAEEQETIAHTSAMKARKAKKPARRRLKDCMPHGEIGSAKQPAHEKLLEQQPVTTHDKNDLPTTHTKRPGLPVSSPENVVGTPQRSEDIDDTWGNKPRSVVSRNRSLVIYDEDWFDSPPSSQNSSKEIVDPENSKAAVPVRNSSVVVEKIKGEIEMKENSSVTSSSSLRDSVSSDKERLALNTAAEKTGDKMALSERNSDREGNGTAASSAGLQSQLATVPDDGQVWIEPPSVKPPPRRQLVTYNDDWLDPCEDTAKYESFGSASLKPAGRNRKKSKSKKHRNQKKKGESQNKQEPSITVQQVDTTETASAGADPDKQSKRINGSVVTVPQMDAGSGAYRPPLSQQEVKLEPVVRQKLHEVLFAPVAPAAFPPEETERSLQKTAGELKVKVMDDGSVQLGESLVATGTQLPDGTAEKAAAMSMLVGGESKLLDSIGSYKCKPDWVTSELENAVSKILDSTYGTIQRQCRHLRGEKVVESKAERKSEDVEAVPVSRFDQSNSAGVKAQTENVDVSTVHVESPSVVKAESATRSKSVPSTSIGEDHLRLRISTHTKDSSETTLFSVSENHSLPVAADTFKDSKISLNKVGNDSKSTQPLHVSAGLGIGVEDGGENVKEHQRARTCAGNVAQVARIHEVEKNPPTSALQSTCMSELEESSQSMPSASGHSPVVTHSESATQSQLTNVKKKVKSRRSNFLLTPFLSQLRKEGSRETASEASMDFMKSLLQKQQQGPEPKPAAQAVEQPPQVARNVKSGRQGARNSRIKKLDKKPRREAEPYSVDSDSDSNSSSTSSSSSSSSLSWGHHIRNSHFSESILPQDRTAKSVRTGRVAKGQVTGVSHDDSHWVDTAGSQAWDRSNQRRTDLKKSRKAPQNGHSSEGFAKQRCQKNGFESSLPRNGRHSAWKGNESSVAKAHQEKESSYSGRGAWYEPGNESTPHHGYQYEDYSYQDSGQYLQSAADYYNYWDNGNNSSSYQAYNQSRLFEHVEDGYQGAEDTWGYSGWGGGDSQMYSGHEDTAQAQEGVSQGWWGPGTGTYSDHGFHQQDWHSQGWDHTGNGCQDYGNDWVQEVQGDPVAWYLHKALQARLRETRQQRHQQSLRKEMDYQSEYIAMMVKGAKNGFRK